jgi:regulator of replication initiation timing
MERQIADMCAELQELAHENTELKLDQRALRDKNDMLARAHATQSIYLSKRTRELNRAKRQETERKSKTGQLQKENERLVRMCGNAGLDPRASSPSTICNKEERAGPFCGDERQESEAESSVETWIGNCFNPKGLQPLKRPKDWWF